MLTCCSYEFATPSSVSIIIPKLIFVKRKIVKSEDITRFKYNTIYQHFYVMHKEMQFVDPLVEIPRLIVQHLFNRVRPISGA